MNKVLDDSLKMQGRGCSFYDVIENCYDIHLGVADKALLLRELRDFDLDLGSLTHLYARILNDFGYESVKFREAFKHHTEMLAWCGRVGNHWLKTKSDDSLID